nr:MAG TPA: hypothetical protein [Caudoviricetes sp.]
MNRARADLHHADLPFNYGRVKKEVIEVGL